MDFARKQLEKYGWSDGKGLGKNENGISEALKPKLKRSVAGIGYDAARDFTEHWWCALYDKAASNVEVDEKNGKTKRMKRKDEEFEITNSTWKLKRKSKDKDEKEYSEFFIKTAVIDTGGMKSTKAVDSDDDDDSDDKNVITMTDEELFSACQGRTAHKGARHGLRALGKLARIEQQEKLLLQQTKYQGYSHSKMLEKSNTDAVVDDTNLNSDTEAIVTKKKKKKKHCNSSNNKNCDGESGDKIENDCDSVDINSSKKKLKKKKILNNFIESNDLISEQVDNEHDSTASSRSKKKSKKEVEVPMIEDNQEFETDKSDKPKRKKKKLKHNEVD